MRYSDIGCFVVIRLVMCQLQCDVILVIVGLWYRFKNDMVVFNMLECLLFDLLSILCVVDVIMGCGLFFFLFMRCGVVIILCRVSLNGQVGLERKFVMLCSVLFLFVYSICKMVLISSVCEVFFQWLCFFSVFLGLIRMFVMFCMLCILCELCCIFSSGLQVVDWLFVGLNSRQWLKWLCQLVVMFQFLFLML